MGKRIVSGAILMSILGAVVLLNLFFPYGMNLVVGALCAWAVYEITNAMGLAKRWEILLPGMGFALALPLVTSWAISWYLIGACYLLYTLAFFALMLFHHEKLPFAETAATFAMTLLIVSAMNCLVYIRDFAGQHAVFYVYMTICASWVSDAGAYFAGSFWGKHKLCPKLSPKKTVEGVFGGFFLNILAMIVFGVSYNYIFYGGVLHMSYLSLVLIGLITTVISILGDLSFSFIKRTRGIKDYGTTIPGHGGILDRFDSVVFVAPFVYFFVQLLPMIVPSAGFFW